MKDDFFIDTALLQLISSEQANHYRIIPHKISDKLVTFKTDQVSELLKQELEIVFNQSIELVEESSEVINRYLKSQYRFSKTDQIENFRYSEDFLDKILRTAKLIGSSDIHFEPYEHQCRIRFRLNGKLKEYYVISLNDYPVLINKLKIKAGLDISEKRLPQDGRISSSYRDEAFDIRVSSLPTLHGEKLVLRILSKNATQIALEQLGFQKEAIKNYVNCIKKSHGIILISGPTGSGKTTTLYATLKLLNNPDTNVLTIEDPIEYTLEGINQVQLKESIGLDFPNALRTFLRQDPDIIMVGEIRDVKTAQIAIRAALTGHLVLSTIHTNSAWATISRLIDMGIPPFLIGSTLQMSVAQRLVRVLCENCKAKKALTRNLFPPHFKAPFTISKHYTAVGCATCFFTGYIGRQAVYEVLPITKQLQVLIKKQALDIHDYMQEHNIITLKDHAYQLVHEGVTSIKEVYGILNEQ